MTDSISIQVQGGSFSAHVHRPGGSIRAAVVVLHEIFGVNDDMRGTCAWLASHGFLAVAPDLFWRQEPGVDLSDASESSWQRGFALYQAFDRERALADIAATVAKAREIGGPLGSVGVMGYCLGGLMTFRAAARQIGDAAVSYYGAETDRYLDEARDLRVPLMVHLAENDEYMPPASRQAIVDALHGRDRVEVYGYAGCSHAFARRGGQHYVAEAAALANERTLRFLLEYLC